MSDKTQNAAELPVKYPNERFRFIDGFVLVFFILTAFLGLYLFRQDLMQTFEIRDAEPAGIITLRNNVVQRRHDDRVLWDRIFVNSYVYTGDLIRVASVSSANINIAANEIFLNENTLIRIEGSMDSSGTFRVELQQGNLSVSSGENSSGIMLNLMGNEVITSAGTMLEAAVNEDGMSLQINEGKAEIIKEGKTIELKEGSVIAYDTYGTERVSQSVVVKRPVNNARYLKGSQNGYTVNFEWSRVNINEGEPIRLEISNDFNYKNIISSINVLNNGAQITFDTGQWYWRLMYHNTLLRKGWINIIDSLGPALISPAADTLFLYHKDFPQLRFQWMQQDWASSYIIEISEEQNFLNPAIRKQINSNSFVTSELGGGEWYWRVKPVFPSAYIGETYFSGAASFIIEQSSDIMTNTVVISNEAAQKARAAIAEAARNSATASEPVFMSVTAPVPAPAPTNINAVSSGHSSPAPGIIQPPAALPAAPARTEKGIRYTIRSGDTLGRLARQHYGNAMLWTIIVEANDIKNPDLIYPGQVYLIP